MVPSLRSSAGAKALAIRAGLGAGAAAVRVARATRDEQTFADMNASFARGDLATWRYDSQYAQRATDPSCVLPGARSVVCIAVAYATPGVSAGRLHGRISNYAWSYDYHTRVRGILEAIAAALDDVAGEPVTAIVCDTRPLAERAFAAQSGLGWVGKHTNVISADAGSFVFLGEVITTLDLEADSPSKKSCGSCDRCVRACPTGALRGDYTIDATRCISDITQRRAAIPRELRALVGQWVWGCDICQIVCPPTQRAPYANPEFNAPIDGELASPSLERLLLLTDGEFQARYKASAAGWRGATILRRNAAVALGNTLDRASAGALERSLESDPSALVRAHAAWALGRIGSPRALRALVGRRVSEVDASVLEEIAWALEPFATDAR